MYCVNHPSVETGVTCSSCGDPICPDCMIFTPVGAKCAKCGKMPRSAMIRVKPERMMLTVVIGIGAAAFGGYVFALLLSASFISFFAFILAFGLGAGVGEAVSRASGRHHGNRLAAWSAACAALGVFFGVWAAQTSFTVSLFAFQYSLTHLGIWGLLWMGIAAFGAWRRNA